MALRNRYVWRAENTEHMKRLIAKGYPITRIARRLNRSTETVVKKAADFGTTLPPSSNARAERSSVELKL